MFLKQSVLLSILSIYMQPYFDYTDKQKEN